MSDTIVDRVREGYAAVAAGTLTGDSEGVRAVAEAFGYSAEELRRLPAEANMGLSCGNPTAFASLRPGEVVIDLGCGGGLDVLLAAEQVGPTGRAIGIDMTPEMLDRARDAARRMGATNAEFRQGTIDALPLDAASVDCIISNCVINLAPDKGAVFREMARVLKPTGRVAISDIAILKPLPDELAQNVSAYVGCIAGAISVGDYESGLRAAGFSAIQVVPTGADLNAYALVDGQAGCCSPAMPAASSPLSLSIATTGCCSATPMVHEGLAELAARYDLNEYAASVRVYAVRGGS
jgi:SAM-dependent methyltransferase